MDVRLIVDATVKVPLDRIVSFADELATAWACVAHGLPIVPVPVESLPDDET